MAGEFFDEEFALHKGGVCELGLGCGDEEGRGGWGYFFEEDLDLGFGVLLFFCGFGGDVGGRCEAGVGVEECVCLVLWSVSDYMSLVRDG